MKSKRPTALITNPNLNAAAPEGGRLVQVILNADLRNGPDGLLELGKKKGVDWNRLRPGQFVAFVNGRLDRFMLLGISPSRKGVVVVYYKSYAGRIERQEMESLPLAFGVNAKLEAPRGVAKELDARTAYQRTRRLTGLPDSH